MLIIKINITPQKAEIMFKSEDFVEFDMDLLDLKSFFDKKIGDVSYLVFNHLSATVMHRTSEYIIVNINKILIDEFQDRSLSKNIVHNLNNIITAINNNAYLLSKKVFDDDTAELAMVIVNASRTATLLSKSYLKYSISRKIDDEIEFDIRELISDCINILTFRLTQRKIAVIYKYDELLPFFKGKKGDVQQIILAVLINAIEAYEDFNIVRERNLIVKATYKDDEYVVEVMDNGKGMSEENYSRVFEEGFTTKKSGNGFGLSFSKALIESLDGKINIRSKEGEGTIVKMIF